MQRGKKSHKKLLSFRHNLKKRPIQSKVLLLEMSPLNFKLFDSVYDK